ncbi:MAG: DUF4279 domain-containing protein [Candidatus Kapabacteria bacterium]|nr:DUF4279 domain-containing protein [Candidatus Kapabacteria bacterium]
MQNTCKTTNIKIEFTIFGDNFNPNELTTQIGILPTGTYLKDTEIPLYEGLIRKGQPKLYKESSWEYSTEYVENLFLDEIIDPIIDIFSKKINLIYNYIQKNDLTFKIFIVVEIINKKTPALGAHKKLIDFAHALDAEIEFDIYVV